MEFAIDIAKKSGFLLSVVVVLYLISLQLGTLALEPEISQAYIQFYRYGVVTALAGVIAIAVWMLYREINIGEILDFSLKEKLAINAVFIIIIMVLTVGAGQILPVPRASVQGLQMTAETELWTSSVIPGYIEDTMYLMAFPMILSTFLLAIFGYVFGDPSRTQAAGVIVVACLIASTGFNIWLIPGFTSAHVPAYGEYQEAYIGAWIFSFGQSMTYMFTGWFVPVAHILHNAWIAAGDLYGINVEGFIVTQPS